MTDKELSILKNTIGQMAADADDKGQTDFGLRLSVADAFNLCKLEPPHRWIPCSERLPDLIPCKAGTAYSEKVIVWTAGRKAMVCVWDGKDWFVPYGFWEVWGKDVTHWMPLPDPPEGLKWTMI